MPTLRIETNVPKSKISQDFFAKATSVLAKTLGRPEQLCCVFVISDIPMTFGGSTEPCAITRFQSIGVQGVELNKKHSKVIFDLIEAELGVPQDRMYITFEDASAADIGYKGTTFHSIGI